LHACRNTSFFFESWMFARTIKEHSTFIKWAEFRKTTLWNCAAAKREKLKDDIINFFLLNNLAHENVTLLQLRSMLIVRKNKCCGPFAVYNIVVYKCIVKLSYSFVSENKYFIMKKYKANGSLFAVHWKLPMIVIPYTSHIVLFPLQNSISFFEKKKVYK
jgi:hypothetical protein